MAKVFNFINLSKQELVIITRNKPYPLTDNQEDWLILDSQENFRYETEGFGYLLTADGSLINLRGYMGNNTLHLDGLQVCFLTGDGFTQVTVATHDATARKYM